MNVAPLIGAVEPDVWLLAFYERTTLPWFDRLCPGRFKHVSAFGYLCGVKKWLYVDANFSGLTIMVLAPEVVPPLMRGAAVVRIEKRREQMRFACRWGFYCVPVVKHLVGLKSSALNLTPTGLYRSCLHNGGVEFGSAENQAGPLAPVRAGPSPE